MKRKGRALQGPYREALRRYLEQGTAVSLQSAQGLGRRMVALGLDTLDLARIHEQAMEWAVDELPIDSSDAQDRIVKRAGTFFAEAILPMEATHPTAREVSRRLSEMNQALRRRIRNILASKARLKKEIARRRAAEESLRKSERQSSQLLAQSRLLHKQLHLLSRRVLSTQEEERKRISRELHDVIAQMLTGINVRLSALKVEAAASTKGISQKISRTQRLVEKSVDTVHRFARELRPAALDDLGLIPALQSFLKDFMAETGIRGSLTAFAGVEGLSSARKTALYRVAQESLSNVARHAQAARVKVSIERLPHALLMQIEDDGKSFDLEQVLHARKSRRLGLLGMRERMEMVGGRFSVEPSPEKGTTVRAEIPLPTVAKENVRP